MNCLLAGSRLWRGVGGLRDTTTLLLSSRPLHSALKRQLKAEKKQKEKEAKEAQQPQAEVSTTCKHNCVSCINYRHCIHYFLRARQNQRNPLRNR